MRKYRLYSVYTYGRDSYSRAVMSKIFIGESPLDFYYYLNYVIEEKNYDDNYLKECAPGIHFFMTKEECRKELYKWMYKRMFNSDKVRYLFLSRPNEEKMLQSFDGAYYHKYNYSLRHNVFFVENPDVKLMTKAFKEDYVHYIRYLAGLE